MDLAKCFSVSVLILAATCWQAIGQEDVKKMPIETLIGDLSSADGTKRIAATAELFRRGKDVLPDLKKAGAKQIAPFEGSVGTRRLDMVYSLIEGFPPKKAAKDRDGYTANSFGLHVEKGTTEEDIQKICKTYQCTLVGKFTTEGQPNCYLQIRPGTSLEAVIQQILTRERKVTTSNLNYVEQ